MATVTWGEVAVEDSKVVRLLAENAHLQEIIRGLQTRIGEMEKAMERPGQVRLTVESAAGLAHEFRNPMSAIGNCIEILSRTLHLEGDEKELIDIALSEWERLNRKITDFLSFARPKLPNRSMTDLSQLLDKNITLIQHDMRYTPAIQIITNLDQSIPKVFIDRDQFSQIFWNLLLNAIQAMPEGGEIVVKTGLEYNDKKQHCVSIGISDNGPGMTEEVKRQALRPFFTTKSSGSGLGLAIVHQIVSAHQGEMVIKSEEGRGTEIDIFIPLTTPPS